VAKLLLDLYTVWAMHCAGIRIVDRLAIDVRLRVLVSCYLNTELIYNNHNEYKRRELLLFDVVVLFSFDNSFANDRFT